MNNTPSGQYATGRRTAMWDGCRRSVFTWDMGGRLSKEQRWLDGTSYVTESKFDALDRLYQLILPDGETLTHTYAADGLLSQLGSSVSSSTLLSGVQYTALGQPKRYTLGSGTTAEGRHTYYGLEGVPTSGGVFGALKTQELQQGSSAHLVHRVLSYDLAGKLSAVNDLVHGEHVSFAYDDLDRLLSAGAPLNESYQYNAIGNLVSKNGQALSYGDAAHKHAVTSFNGTAYSYDANGSMTARGGQSLSYDPERRPVRLAQGGQTVWRAAYDGDGVRRKRLDANGTVHYLGAYERNVGNGQDTSETVTKYYAALGRLIAFRKNGSLRWVGTDHLGSTVRVANANFAALDQMRYTPWGVSRDAGTNLDTDHKFTSQVEDASLRLYWYVSRAYDPALGRFTCPDSIVPNPGNPQSLNRYSYVRNNPLGYTDPTGHRERRRQDYAAGAAGELQYHGDRMHDLAEQGLIESGPGGSRQEGMAREAAGAASRRDEGEPRRADYANGAAGELQYQRHILTRMAEQGLIASGPGGASLEAAAVARAAAAQETASLGPTYVAMQQAPQRRLPELHAPSGAPGTPVPYSNPKPMPSAGRVPEYVPPDPTGLEYKYLFNRDFSVTLPLLGPIATTVGVVITPDDVRYNYRGIGLGSPGAAYTEGLSAPSAGLSLAVSVSLLSTFVVSITESGEVGIQNGFGTPGGSIMIVRTYDP
jgi:RHS repeat-associated protein